MARFQMLTKPSGRTSSESGDSSEPDTRRSLRRPRSEYSLERQSRLSWKDPNELQHLPPVHFPEEHQASGFHSKTTHCGAGMTLADTDQHLPRVSWKARLRDHRRVSSSQQDSG